MKSVLISTHPKWVEKICHKIGEDETGKAIYEKRIEVRKTAPQEVPFKCYIYETKGQYVKFTHGAHTKYGYGCGKVIGEFICNSVDEYHYDYCDGVDIDDDTILETAIDREDINIYAKGKTLYGWHISDLKIYDTPKELSEFNAVCKYINEDKSCHFRKVMCPYQQFDYNEDGSINIVECSRVITRPPLSWCYVEDLGEEE